MPKAEEQDRATREAWYERYAWRFRHIGPPYPEDLSFDCTHRLMQEMEGRTTEELALVSDGQVEAWADEEIEIVRQEERRRWRLEHAVWLAKE